MTAADALVEGSAELWQQCVQHPFVQATADGTLPEAAFDRWLLADHAFVVGFRRFLGGLLAIAPTEDARDVLAGGIAALTPELALFRAQLAERGLDPATYQPDAVCLGYTSYLLACLADGWQVAAAVLYGAEKAYLDAWTAVREQAVGARYQGFVDNWSSPQFAGYVDALGRLLGDGEPTAAQREAFGTVVRLELAFWDAVAAG